MFRAPPRIQLFSSRRIIKTEVFDMLKLSVVVFRRHENQHVKFAILMILRDENN